jgi:putative ABC transport system permease protein
MIGSRLRKIFRDVWARKSRALMASTAIFVGVLGVVTLLSAGDLLTSQLEQDLREEDLAMQAVFVSAPGGSELDNEAYLRALEEVPGVTRVEGRAVQPLSWKLPGEDEFEDAFVLAAWEPFEEIAIQPSRVAGEGRYPSSGQQEIAVEKRMADKHELSVGDQIVLRSAGGDAEGDPWTITGLVFMPYASFGSMGLPVPNDASLFATFEDAQVLAGFAGFNTLYARYTDYPTAEAQADGLYAAIAQETPYIAVFSYTDDPAESFYITQTEEMTSMLSMLGIIAMIVAGLLVLNVINSIVGEDKRQIGVMKSLGATRWDNFVIYAGIAITFGVIGAVPGVLLGSYLGVQMAQAIDEPLLTYIEGFSLSSSAIMVGLVMGLAIPFFAAIVPVLLGTRVTILQAMTDVGISADYGKSRWSRVLTAMPLPTNTKQAVTNVLRKKGRLALTWLTLTLAAAAFMGIFGMFVSINDKIGDVFDSFNAQITVVPNERQDFDHVRALVLEGVAGIEAVDPGIGLSVELDGYVSAETGTSQLQMTGLAPAADSMKLDIKAGTAWQDDPEREGLVLTRGVADGLGKTVGDTATLVAQGQRVDVEIIGIAAFLVDQGFMEWQELARLVGSVDAQGEPAPTSMMIRLSEPDPTVDEVDEVIDELDEVLLSNGISASHVNQVKFAEDMSKMITMFGSIFQIAAIVMAVIGAIGLLSTLSMSVFERLREIGIMRSIGAGSGTIAGQFLTEGMLVGLSAWLVAVPLSYLIAEGLLASMEIGMEGLGFDTSALWIGLVGMIVITVLASLGPSLSAARKTVSEILRYQ